MGWRGAVQRQGVKLGWVGMEVDWSGMVLGCRGGLGRDGPGFRTDGV